MNFLLPTTIVSFIGNVVLGCYALKFDSKKLSNRYFAFLTFVIASWIVLIYVSLLVNDVRLIRILMLLATLWTYSLFMFAYTFSVVQITSKVVYVVTLLAVVFSILSISPYIFSHAEIINGEFVPIPGSMMLVFVLYSISLNLDGIGMLVLSLKRLNALKYFQTLLVIFGILIMMTTILSANFLSVIIFKNVKLIPLGMLSTLFFVGCTTYAITRHRFLNIHVILQQKISKFLLIFLTSITGITIVYIVFQITNQSLIVSGVIALLVFVSMQVVILYITEHYLMRNTIDLALPQKMVYPDALVQQHLDLLLKNINTTLNDNVRNITNITLCIKDWRNKVYQSVDSKVYFSQHHALIHFFKTNPTALILSKPDILHSSLDISMQHELNAVMKKKSFTHALVIRDKRDIYGFIFFTLPVDTLEQTGVLEQDWLRWAQRFCEELRMILQYDAVTNNPDNLRRVV